jgi:hypothetical protein
MIIEILDNLIGRLNNMFTVQTQEVIPELNKIKELLEQKPQEKPVVIVEEKEINNEPAQEVNKEPVEEIKEFVSAEDNVVERAKEYLKDK